MAKKSRGMIDTPIPAHDALNFDAQIRAKKTKEVATAAALVRKFDNPVKTGMVWSIKDLDTEFEKRKQIKKDW